MGDKGKAKMEEDKKEKEEEEAPMEVDHDDSKQSNEETGVQRSNQSAFLTRKGIATSYDTNPQKRKPGMPSLFKCGEKSLKISSDKGERINLFVRRVPPTADASSPKGNTENTTSSAILVHDRASKPPLGKSRFSNDSSSSSAKPPSSASFPGHLFADPSRAVGAGKGNSRLDNSSTGEHTSGYTVVMRRRFTVTSRLSCFHPSTGGGDDDCNTMPNNSFTNPQSKNPAAADATDRNTRLNKPSPDLSSEAASSPKGNTASSATLVQDRAPKPPPGKSRFSRESSSSSPKTTSCAPFPSPLFTDPFRPVGTGKGNSRLDNSGKHVSGYSVVNTVPSGVLCFQHSTAGGDDDRNRRPNSSSTNPQSENTAADASDRNTRLYNPSPDLASAAAGDDTLLSANLVLDTTSLPPPPELNVKQVAEGKEQYLKLVQSYLKVFSAKDSPPAEHAELVNRLRQYLAGYGHKKSELQVELIYSDANMAVLKGPLGNFTIDLEPPIRMLSVRKTTIIFMEKKIKTKDTNMRFKLPEYFAKKIVPLLDYVDDTEDEGVQVKVFDNELRSWEIRLKGIKGKHMFLYKGWTEFRRNKNWLKLNMLVTIGVFIDFQSKDVSFIVLPGSQNKKKAVCK